MESLKSLFKLKNSQVFYLHRSENLSVQVCLASVHPELRLSIRLSDAKHHLDLSPESWNILTNHSRDLQKALHQSSDVPVFATDEIRVFASGDLGDRAICFVDAKSSATKICLGEKSFRKLVALLPDVSSVYLENFWAVQEIARSLKSFVDRALEGTENPTLASAQKSLEAICEMPDPCLMGREAVVRETDQLSFKAYMSSENSDSSDDNDNDYDCQRPYHKFRRY